MFFTISLANLLSSMYRSNRNSMDKPAVSSGLALQPNSSSSSQRTLPPFFSVSSSAEQAPYCYSNIEAAAVSSQDDVQSSVAISESSQLTEAQTLSPYTSSLLGIGSSLPQDYSSLAASSKPGRPAFGVPFVATFAPPNPSLVSFRNSTSSASARPVVSSDTTSLPSGLILHQSFVLGQDIPPVPATLVNQIVSGKYVDLCDLLSRNLAYVEPEPQVLLDGFIRPSKENYQRHRFVDRGLHGLFVCPHLLLPTPLEGFGAVQIAHS